MSLSLNEFLARAENFNHHALLLLSRRFAVEGMPSEALRAIAQTYCGIALPVGDESSFWEDAARHPDLAIVDRERAILRKEEVESLRKLAIYPPNLGRRRLFVIDRCERLNVHAANSLLKVLEEPSVNALFIFTAKSLADVLPTVVSRCQRVSVMFSEEVRRIPSEAFEAEDWAWISQWFNRQAIDRPIVCGSLNEPFSKRDIKASLLAEVLTRSQMLGKKYSADVLQDGIAHLLVETMTHPSQASMVNARYVQADLKTWRDDEAFNPSSEFWLARIFLRFA